MPKRPRPGVPARSTRARPRKPTRARPRASTAANTPAALRQHIVAALDWHDAHAGFDAALGRVPPDLRGRKPDGLPYSLWRLLEHLRLAQRDILAFCKDPGYVAAKWPDDYWPASDAPPNASAWDEAIGGFRRDLGALKRLAANPRVNLFAKIPHGSGQTYLRELLLVIDHNAHHIGQIVTVRRLLGAWPA